MKKLLLSTAMLLAVAGAASAADLGTPYYKAPPAYAPAWSWTGFYGGVNLGGGWARGTETDTVTGLGSISATETLSGVIGGAQIGYNWQVSTFVFGLEADVDGSGESVTNNFSCAVLVGGCGVSVTDRVNAFGTARGRVGWAFDRFLVYATGGFAWQNFSRSVTVTVPGFIAGTASASTTRGGYAVGGGVEAALWGNWIGGVEYLYLDTGTWTADSVTVGAGTVSQSLRLQNSVVRGRLSYKF
jgi:outer membrane immunogenic protein